MADQGSEGLLSPWLRQIRFKAALPYLKGNILDYGCGSGELAKYADPSCYLGVEIDAISLKTAQKNFPNHSFVSSLEEVNGQFETIVSLAVLEHVDKPALFLASLRNHLAPTNDARIAVTTPHPSVDWVHTAGAAIGLFSRHANEEHEELLNRNKLIKVGEESGLELVNYKKFLFGANQLAVFQRRPQCT